MLAIAVERYKSVVARLERTGKRALETGPHSLGSSRAG